MKYTRFEQLVLVAGGAAILGGAAISVTSGSEPTELIAQGLLFVVLYAAVRFGRRGGLIAAIAASAAYMLLKHPSLSTTPITTAELVVLAARLGAYGLIGVVGGEICMRMRYNLTKLEGRSALDDWSHVYNQRYIRATLEQALMRYDRYHESFCTVIVTVSPSVFAEMSPARQRTLVRGLADHIRADVRMVDDVARLADGRFVVLLPHTTAEGALIVRDRLVMGVRDALGARAEAVSARCLTLPADEDALRAFVDSIDDAVAEDQADGESGAYSSSASSTLKPASASAFSASAVSTLNTSTAASPEGSTKQ